MQALFPALPQNTGAPAPTAGSQTDPDALLGFEAIFTPVLAEPATSLLGNQPGQVIATQSNVSPSRAPLQPLPITTSPVSAPLIGDATSPALVKGGESGVVSLSPGALQIDGTSVGSRSISAEGLPSAQITDTPPTALAQDDAPLTVPKKIASAAPAAPATPEPRPEPALPARTLPNITGSSAPEPRAPLSSVNTASIATVAETVLTPIDKGEPTGLNPFKTLNQNVSGPATAPLSDMPLLVADQGSPAPAARAGTAATVVPTSVDATAQAASEQIRAAIMAKPNAGIVEVQLDPPELGRVQLEIDSSRQGQVRIVVAAAEPETFELLRRHQSQLMAELNDQGFDDVDLDWRGHDEARTDHWRSPPQDTRTETTTQQHAPVLPEPLASTHDGRIDLTL